MMWAESLRLTLGLIGVALAGNATLAVPPFRRFQVSSVSERLGLSILLGMGTVSSYLLVLSLIGWTWEPWQLYLLWTVAVIVGVIPRGVRAARRRGLSQTPELRLLIAWGAFSVVSLLVLLTGLGQRATLRDSPDAAMFYAFKGRIFYEDGSVRPYYEQVRDHPSSALITSQPDHPPLVPVTMAALALAAGRFDGHIPTLISWMTGVGLTLTFYGLLRRLGSTAVAAGLFSSLLGLQTVAPLAGFGLPGYAESSRSCVLSCLRRVSLRLGDKSGLRVAGGFCGGGRLRRTDEKRGDCAPRCRTRLGPGIRIPQDASNTRHGLPAASVWRRRVGYSCPVALSARVVPRLGKLPCRFFRRLRAFCANRV